jgi:gluconolactonase
MTPQPRRRPTWRHRARSTETIAPILSVALCVGCEWVPTGPTPRSEYRRGTGTIERTDAALSAIVPEEAVVEQVATGFTLAEGPVWVERDGEPYLAFSDLRANALHRWYLDGRLVTVTQPFRRGLGRPARGPNGITLDSEGRLVICDSSNRRILRLEHDGSPRVLADRYRGGRLNSPNDLVYRSDGALYFTDPPHGLAGGERSPDKEQPFNGVYRLRTDGGLDLVASDLPRPNGIAFSPDEQVLYVSNTAPKPAVVMSYDVLADGTLGDRKVFYDFTPDGGADGVKVDREGRVYVATCRGVAVLTADGQRLGTIHLDQCSSNLAWGEDGTVLYITANSGLYRVRLAVFGVRPLPAAITNGSITAFKASASLALASSVR